MTHDDGRRRLIFDGDDDDGDVTATTATHSVLST
jgi:hypothetical protein